jgi:hypothetical protein
MSEKSKSSLPPENRFPIDERFADCETIDLAVASFHDKILDTEDNR